MIVFLIMILQLPSGEIDASMLKFNSMTKCESYIEKVKNNPNEIIHIGCRRGDNL